MPNNRGRLRIFAAVGAIALVVLAAVLALRGNLPAGDPAGASTSPSSPARSADGAPSVDLAPSQRLSDLPQLSTVLPPVINVSQAGVPKLSDRPVRRAAALVQPVGDGASSAPVLVVGDDGLLRVLDTVALAPPTDPDGNAHHVLSPTALSPDGLRAAFPQRDQIVVVDLVSGRPTTVPLPGYNEFVRWHGAGLIVDRAGSAVFVDLGSGTASPVAYPTGDLASVPSTTTAAPAVSLLPGMIRTWPATGAPADTAITGAAAGAAWAGPGWATGGRIARAAHLPGRDGFGAVVVEEGTGATVRMLQLCHSAAPISGCGAVAGWLDGDTVLVHVGLEQDWLLGWHVGTGRLSRVTEFFENVTVAVAIVP